MTATARMYLGRLYKTTGEYRKAQQEFEQSRQLIDSKTDLSLLDLLLLLQGETAIDL